MLGTEGGPAIAPKQASASRVRSPSRLTAIAAVAVAVLALVAYAPIWLGDYQFLNVDDDEYVTENQYVKAGLTGSSVWWALTAYHSHNWHPLTWMSLQLDCQLFGLNPRGFHITNILLHTANTVLLFFALRSLTGAVWRSAIVAAFFAVHPLHVESVAWVAERKDVLSTLFLILTLWAYSAYAAQPGWHRYLLTFLLFALGLMAKPMLVTLPCVLLLLDFWPLRRLSFHQPAAPARTSLAGAAGWWWLVVEKLPFFAVVAGCCVLTLQAQKDIMQTLDYMPLSQRLTNTPLAYLTYIGMMFWPMHLTVFYPHPGASLSYAFAASLAGLLLLVTALMLSQARRRPYLAMGWLWYLGTLVPVIGLVQVGRQAHADRYTYIPLIGLFLMLAWGAHDLSERRRPARLAAAPILACLLVACLFLTWRQLPTWQSSSSLWQHALNTYPSGIAHQGQAMALEKQGRLDEARREYAETIRFDPTAVAYYFVGVFLAKHGWLDDALEHFAQSLAQYPDYSRAHHNMGLILLEQGKLDESREHLTGALRLEPNFAAYHTSMGRLLMKSGQVDQAQQHLSEAVRLAPDSADGHYYLGLFLEQQGRFREAEAELVKALKMKPRSANARYHLGVVFEGQGLSREAAECFDSALQRDPNHVEALVSLGAWLARNGQLAKAQEYFRAALSLDPKNGRAHFNLGLALELDGRYVEAYHQFADAVLAAPNDAEARRCLEAARKHQSLSVQFRVLPLSIAMQ